MPSIARRATKVTTGVGSPITIVRCLLIFFWDINIVQQFLVLKQFFLFNQIHKIACFLRTGSTVDLTAKHVTVLAAYRSALKMERIIGEE